MTDTFSRRVLMCVSGMSPAVITETLYALVMQTPPFVPDEIHVVTTANGKQKVLDALLQQSDAHREGRFHQFMRDYLPGHTMRFNEDTVHVISRQCSNAAITHPFSGLIPASPQESIETVELSDITTNDDNEAAADTIYKVMRDLKSVPGTQLHASVAGGRKSMSFYMGHAFSLLAEPADSLSHVLVNEPFENPKLDFFYPRPSPVELTYLDHQGTVHSISTACARIQLAELSVLKLGGLLGQDWPVKALHSFAFAVKLAQAALVTPELKVVLGSVGGRSCGWLEVCGERIELPPLQFALFALYALACVHQDELPGGAQVMLAELPAELWSALTQDLDGSRFEGTADFKAATSRALDALGAAVGPVAQHFRIEAVGRKVKGSVRPSAMQVHPSRLKLVGLQGWWMKLKAVLS